MIRKKYNQKTHEQFLKELFDKNEWYRLGDFSVKSKYTTCKTKILLGTKYGDVKVRPDHLLNNLKFTIESAVDKNEYAKNRIQEVHGDIFDLSKVNYTRSRDNIIIGCKKHGFVEVQFNNLLQYRGCSKCGLDLLKEEVKDNGGWEYSKWEEKGLKSKSFDSFKVYIIRCWNEEEEFYKIGKTFVSVENRMKGRNPNCVLPYNWEIIKLYELENPRDICTLETEIKNLHKEYRYTPKIKFSGYRECYLKLL